PVFNGFWKEDTFLADRMNLNRTTYNSVQFNTMLMRSIALYPTKSGKLQIPSLELLVDIRTKPASFFDLGSTKRYNIRSKPLTVNVKELPTEGKPADYAGAVGSFTLKSNISTAELKVGEPLTYTLEITGTGNLNQFDPPELPEIQNFRFIDPEITTEISKDQISGKKIIKYLVIAQEKGDFSIPALSFSYFDTQAKRYVTRKTKPYSVSVLEGDQIYIPSSSAQSLVTLEGSDIGFIIREPNLSTSYLYYNSFFYWLLIFIIFMGFPASNLYFKKHEQVYSDKDFIRQKQADKILKKYLKEASRKFNSQDPEFYSDVQIGLSNFLTDKIRINRGSETSTILNQLKRSVDDDLQQKVEDIFSKCDQARFMPGGFSRKNMEKDFQMLKQTISELTRVRF
ncbi:BatD family protein, partial [Candidatus Cloacimonadota bacterium]